LFFFFLLFHASMMSDLIVDAHDVVRSESHPVSLSRADYFNNLALEIGLGFLR
jgi:hypothetical protein